MINSNPRPFEPGAVLRRRLAISACASRPKPMGPTATPAPPPMASREAPPPPPSSGDRGSLRPPVRRSPARRETSSSTPATRLLRLRPLRGARRGAPHAGLPGGVADALSRRPRAHRRQLRRARHARVQLRSWAPAAREAVKDYLTERGIPAARIDTVSYGKEHPVDTGSGDEADAHNRNARTIVDSGARRMKAPLRRLVAVGDRPSGPATRFAQTSHRRSAGRSFGQAAGPDGKGGAGAARHRLPGPRHRPSGGGRAGGHRQPPRGSDRQAQRRPAVDRQAERRAGDRASRSRPGAADRLRPQGGQRRARRQDRAIDSCPRRAATRARRPRGRRRAAPGRAAKPDRRTRAGRGRGERRGYGRPPSRCCRTSSPSTATGRAARKRDTISAGR